MAPRNNAIEPSSGNASPLQPIVPDLAVSTNTISHTSVRPRNVSSGSDHTNDDGNDGTSNREGIYGRTSNGNENETIYGGANEGTRGSQARASFSGAGRRIDPRGAHIIVSSLATLDSSHVEIQLSITTDTRISRDQINDRIEREHGQLDFLQRLHGQVRNGNHLIRLEISEPANHLGFEFLLYLNTQIHSDCDSAMDDDLRSKYAAQLQAKNEELQAKKDELKAKLKAKKDAHKAEMGAKDAIIESLQAKLKAKKDAHKAEMGAKDAEIKTLQAENDTLKAEAEYKAKANNAGPPVKKDVLSETGAQIKPDLRSLRQDKSLVASTSSSSNEASSSEGSPPSPASSKSDITQPCTNNQDAVDVGCATAQVAGGAAATLLSFSNPAVASALTSCATTAALVQKSANEYQKYNSHNEADKQRRKRRRKRRHKQANKEAQKKAKMKASKREN